MAEVGRVMIYEFALDVLAPAERLDAEIRATVAELRAMRAEAEAAQGGVIARCGAGRPRGV